MMMERFSVSGKLTAKDGKGQELLKILLNAAEEMKKLNDCFCYIVGMNKEEADSVYVYEVWESEKAHKASLELPAVRKLIQNAMPIIDNMSNEPELVIYGGKAVSVKQLVTDLFVHGYSSAYKRARGVRAHPGHCGCPSSAHFQICTQDTQMD